MTERKHVRMYNARLSELEDYHHYEEYNKRFRSLFEFYQLEELIKIV